MILDEHATLKRVVKFTVPVLLVLLALAWLFGKPVYRRHKESRALAQAKDFFTKNDFASASLCARQALLLNSNNLDACKIMVSLAEMAHMPVVVDWRRRVAAIEPTIENKLLLAAAGLRYQSPPFLLSAQLLNDLPVTATNLPSFHLVSAELALKLNRPAEAEQHFAAAAALEPTNRLHQLNLAVLRLRSTNETEAAAARVTLASYSADTNLAPVALRWLVEDALRRKDNQEALRLSAQLLALPSAALEDRLQRLDVLKRAGSDELSAFMAATEARFATNAPAVYGITSWMIANQFTDEALAWLKSLPEAVREQQPVSLAFTDCLFARENWTGLEKYLQTRDWKDLEFLRFAYLSHAADKTDMTVAAEAHWRSAIREAGDKLSALTALLSLAEKWGKKDDSEEMLWRIGGRFTEEKWAFRELERRYFIAGNTLGLNKVYAAQLASHPNDRILKNNLASTSLLLRTKLTEAHQLALEVYTEDATNVIAASTYAFSLHLQAKTAQGLAVLEKFPPEQLLRQPVALYYGVLLCAAAKTDQARPYLEVAAKSRSLLPEEKSLLADCKLPGAP